MNELPNECMEGRNFLAFSNCLHKGIDQILFLRSGLFLKLRFPWLRDPEHKAHLTKDRQKQESPGILRVGKNCKGSAIYPFNLC